MAYEWRIRRSDEICITGVCADFHEAADQLKKTAVALDIHPSQTRVLLTIHEVDCVTYIMEEGVPSDIMEGDSSSDTWKVRQV